MTIQTGELRNKIVIQSKVVSTDLDTQETIETWTDFKTWHCKLMLNNGREFWAAQKLNPELSGIAQGRYISGIAYGMRCKYGERYFDIIGPPIDPEERHEETELHLKEIF